MCSNKDALKLLKKGYPKLRFKEEPTTQDIIVEGRVRILHEYICDKRWKIIVDIIYSEFRYRLT